MKIHRRGFGLTLSAALCGLAFADGARASLGEGKADPALRLIVPFPPGGTADAVARLLGKQMREAAGWHVVVSNLSGASGVIAANALLNSPSSDNDLLYTSTSLLAFVPTLAPQSLAFVPEQALVPIAAIGLQRYLLVAREGFDVGGFLGRHTADGRAPRPVAMGAVGSGSVMAFHSQALGRVLRTELNIIPYRGMADLPPALLSGQIDLAIVDELAAQRLWASRRVQLVATMSPKPCILFPGVALWHELGFAPLDMDLPFVVFGGSRMSPSRRARLGEWLGTLDRMPAFHDTMYALGIQPMVLSGEDAQHYVRQRVVRDRQYIERFSG